MPEWRNWTTHQAQNLAKETSCGFESLLGYFINIYCGERVGIADDSHKVTRRWFDSSLRNLFNNVRLCRNEA